MLRKTASGELSRRDHHVWGGRWDVFDFVPAIEKKCCFLKY